jgi:WD40 repeat protein
MRADDARKRYEMKLMSKDAKSYGVSIKPKLDVDKDSFSSAFVQLDKNYLLPIRIVMNSPDGKTRLWDVTHRPRARLLRVVHGPIQAKRARLINSAMFSPNGDLFVTAGDDGFARLYSATSGALIARLRPKRHRAPVVATFSPDGSRIVTGDVLRTVRVWDVAAKRPLALMTIPNASESGEPAKIWSAGFSQDGKEVMASGGTNATIWTAPDDQPRVAFAGFAASSAVAVTAS